MSRNEYYQQDIKYSTYMVRNIMLTLGIWPSSNRGTSVCKKISKFLIIFINYILLYSLFIPGCLYFLIEKRGHIRLKLSPALLYNFVTIIKYSNLIIRGRQIRHCLKFFEEDWKNVTNVNVRNRMLESAKSGRRLITIGALFFYGSGLFFRTILPWSKKRMAKAQNITIRPLPQPIYLFSVDLQASPVYEMMYLTQCISGIVTFSIGVSICGLVIIFVMHTCGQMKILIDLMKSLVEPSQKDQEIDKKLADVVKQQTKIRSLTISIIFNSFSQSMNRALEQVCLIEITGSTIILCCLCYTFLMESKTRNIVSTFATFFIFSSMVINLFMYCYAGEHLSVQAGEVATISCELEWYHLPNRKARNIVLIMIVSNLPNKLIAGRLIELSFKTYGDILKTSMAYLNMIRNVME